MPTRRLGIAIMLAALPLPAIAIGSCALSGFNRDTSPTAADAGSDVVVSDANDAGDAGDAMTGCQHTTYPDPPLGTQLGGTEEFVVAVRSIDMGEGAAPIGLDLDDLCTCEGEGPSCKSSKQICDGPGGIDNQAQGLFSLFGTLAKSFGSTYFSAASEKGTWSLLMRVKGYNGMPDDDSVELDWYITTSFDTGADGGTMTTPKWDGTDEWPISTSSLAGGIDGGVDMPLYVDPNAYVSGGVIVASLPDAEIVFAGAVSRAVIKVTAGFVIATVAEVPVTGGDAGMSWALRDGLIVGRWKTSDVFATLSSYRDDNGQPFCSNSFAYAPAKQQFCTAADISSTVSTPTTPCDSISLGIGFQSFPAQLGVPTNPAPITGVCPDGGDPGMDSCTPP